MREISLEELLEAGCHFGHQVTRSNPKARDFVFEARDNIQIIDLVKTKEGLDEAATFVKALGQRSGKLLVVATKKQAKDIVVQEVIRVRELLKNSNTANEESLFYITQRWIGGILTNFSEVSKNFQKLTELKDKLSSEEEKAKFTKREIGLWDKERQRLESFYAGIVSMKEKPDALFIVDSHMEDLAVREGISTGVEIVAIVDTNADPFVIDYPIPANDDAVGSIKLIVTHILDAYAEGIKTRKPAITEAQSKTETQRRKPATTETQRKSSVRSVGKSVSSVGARKVLKNKKPATTKTQKKLGKARNS